MTKFTGFSVKEEDKIKNVLGHFDENFTNETFKKITNEEILNDEEEKYSAFGKYNFKDYELKLNPRVFIVEDYSDENKTLSKLGFIILHEVAHALDRKFRISDSKEWQKLSGWEEDPIIKRGKKNLVIPFEDKQIKSKWFYDANKEDFPRWYSALNPKEDLCDSFAFIYNGLNKRFKKEDKIKFIEKLIAEWKVKGLV